MRSHRCGGVLIGLTIGTGLGFAAVAAPPVAFIEPVVDDYFGTRVTDNYRWMENRSAPQFVEWIKEQDLYARAALNGIPHRDELLRRVAFLFRVVLSGVGGPNTAPMARPILSNMEARRLAPDLTPCMPSTRLSISRNTRLIPRFF
jgi:hypothetical protein